MSSKVLDLFILGIDIGGICDIRGMSCFIRQNKDLNRSWERWVKQAPETLEINGWRFSSGLLYRKRPRVHELRQAYNLKGESQSHLPTKDLIWLDHVLGMPFRLDQFCNLPRLRLPDPIFAVVFVLLSTEIAAKCKQFPEVSSRHFSHGIPLSIGNSWFISRLYNQQFIKFMVTYPKSTYNCMVHHKTDSHKL